MLKMFLSPTERKVDQWLTLESKKLRDSSPHPNPNKFQKMKKSTIQTDTNSKPRRRRKRKEGERTRNVKGERRGRREERRVVRSEQKICLTNFTIFVMKRRGFDVGFWVATREK
jgi:hypothetical protein